jgi:membrane dipeptidase
MSKPEAPQCRADESVLALHRQALVFDGLALKYVLDEPYVGRMRQGGVDAINMTIASEKESWDETLEIVAQSLAKIERSPHLMHARTAAEVRAAKEEGRIAVLFGTQGAAMLDGKLSRLEVLQRLGIRYFGPAYTGATVFADGCGEFRNAGLSVLGRELIALANDLDLIIDLSHCGHRSRAEAAELADHPACTHSNAYAVNANDRNTRDETARMIAGKGGVVGICGLLKSVWPEGATLEHMLDHLDHFVGLVGIEHVGLGLDFTEAYQDALKAGQPRDLSKAPKWRRIRPDIFGTVDDFFELAYPAGLESVSVLPNLSQGMRERGYGDADIVAVLGGNWLRQLEESVG